jgi:uncharacterized protein (TIGR02147 family)
VSETKAPDIFAYTDYREFMKDFFTFMKSTKPFFSYQYFAEKAGFKAKSFVHKVIKGERALSQNSLFNIARVLNLKGKEIEFFEALVHFNDASTAQEREYYLDRMQQSEPKHDGVRLKKNQYEYFTKWYHSVVRELVTLVRFDSDYKILADAVVPAITVKQAKESVELLLGLGLIRKNDSTGLYEHCDTYITTRDTVVKVAVNKYQREMMELALKAHLKEERDMRDFSTLTVGISQQGYERIRNELKQFRAHIGRMVAEDNPSDRVYQINFQIFPVSNNPIVSNGDNHETK